MRKLLVVVSAAWIAVTITGVLVSVDRKLPYDLTFLDRAGSIERVGRDWVSGWGTGLAVPLAVLAAVAIATMLSTFNDAGGRLGTLLLALLGGLSLGFTACQQLTQDRLSGAGLHGLETWLVLASLGLSALMVLLGLLAFGTFARRWTG
ncbi:MAG TPA: hypothetical protein VF314_10005 [Actinomycetes bacterium]